MKGPYTALKYSSNERAVLGYSIRTTAVPSRITAQRLVELRSVLLCWANTAPSLPSILLLADQAAEVMAAMLGSHT